MLQRICAVFFILPMLFGNRHAAISGIQRLHVVGAGVMGGDIAAVGAMAGLDVTLTDMNEAAIDGAHCRAAKLFERRLKTDDKIAAAKSRLRATKMATVQLMPI